MDVTAGVTRQRDEASEVSSGSRKDARVEGVSVSAAKGMALGGGLEDAFNERFLKYFYAKLFPYRSMFRWLSYGNDPDSTSSNIKRDYFARREFSFTTGDDAYIRYLSFRDAEALARGVNTRQPYKIDIGAVFSHQPSEHERLPKGALTPMERELVFDIDLTDYDDIPIRVLDQVLRNDFGFRDIMFVYSGRRGVHCWVCDEAARLLPDEARAAIVSYISALHGGDSAGSAGSAGGSASAAMFARINSNLTIPMHPSFVRALADLETTFEKHVIPASGQGLLASPAQWSKVIDLIPQLPEGVSSDFDVRSVIATAWQAEKNTPEKRWRQLKATVQAAVQEMGGSLAGTGGSILVAGTNVSAGARATGAGGAKFPREFRAALEKLVPAIIFIFTYPRLDVNVSKQRHHLLKSPFCIHPKTGRVCVPIPVDAIDLFDPNAVPTVAMLAKEGYAYELSGGRQAAGRVDGDEEMPDEPGAKATQPVDSEVWMHTSLRRHVEYLDAFVAQCLSAAARKRREHDEKGAAFSGEW